MKKSISKLLTLILSFAMVFTSIGWIGAGEVNAEANNSKLVIKVDNYSSLNPEDIDLCLESADDGTADIWLELSNTGEATLDLTDEDPSGTDILTKKMADALDIEDYTYSLVADGYTITPNVAVSFDEDADSVFVDQVNGASFSGSAISVTLTADGGDDPMEGWTYGFDFNTDTSYDWTWFGIEYTEISLSRDFIVDVRHTDSSVTSSAPFIDFSKDPHFVNTDAQCADVTGGVVEAGSPQAQKLDELYTKAAGKRIVIICYGGMTMAKRAMQYYNTKGYDLGPDGDVTYLIGGSNGVLNGDFKANLGITHDAITDKDVLLDVRAKEDFDKGHLKGSVNIDLKNGSTSDPAIDEALQKLFPLPDGGRVVIVCYTGKGLANKAMTYYRENLNEVDWANTTYVIGGAASIPADKMISTEEENNPAPAPAPAPAAPAAVSEVSINAATVSAAAVQQAIQASGGNPDTLVLGNKVKKIKKGAFAGTGIKTLVVTSKKLKKKSVKGSLKGSSVTSVKVKVGKAKANKKYAKKYKKFFTKKNAGKKAKVTKF